jgi:hypothetical protein
MLITAIYIRCRHGTVLLYVMGSLVLTFGIPFLNSTFQAMDELAKCKMRVCAWVCPQKRSGKLGIYQNRMRFVFTGRDCMSVRAKTRKPASLICCCIDAEGVISG